MPVRDVTYFGFHCSTARERPRNAHGATIIAGPSMESFLFSMVGIDRCPTRLKGFPTRFPVCICQSVRRRYVMQVQDVSTTMSASDATSNLLLPSAQAQPSKQSAHDLQENRQHLQDLELTFVSTADVLLCVTQETDVTGYLVHSDVISDHSPVLSGILSELRQQDGHIMQQPQHTHLRLPMVAESCSTVASVLTQMYGAFTRISGSCHSSTSCQVSLTGLRLHADHIRFCHKYGMTAMLSVQDDTLKKPLEVLLSPCDAAANSQTHNDILDFANVMEEYGCMALVHICVAYLVTRFQDLPPGHLDSKLSHASVCQVYQGVVWKQKLSMKAMTDALYDLVAEGKLFASNYNHAYFRGVCCPRCEKPVKLSKKQNYVHKKETKCQWPRRHTYKTPLPPLSDIVTHLEGIEITGTPE